MMHRDSSNFCRNIKNIFRYSVILVEARSEGRSKKKRPQRKHHAPSDKIWNHYFLTKNLFSKAKWKFAEGNHGSEIPLQGLGVAWNNILGKRGEELAVSYLQKKDYRILETNWRYRRTELDIIAMLGEILIFVEVKTRNHNSYNAPDAAVHQKKRDHMATAGAAYMRKIEHDWEIRFDIISIIYKNEQNFSIDHFEDAFFPTD